MLSLKTYNGALAEGSRDLLSVKCYRNNPGKREIRELVGKHLTMKTVLLLLACPDLCDAVEYSRIMKGHGIIIVAERDHYAHTLQLQNQHKVKSPLVLLSLGNIQGHLPKVCDVAFLDFTGCYCQNTRNLLNLAVQGVRKTIILGVSDSCRWINLGHNNNPLFNGESLYQNNMILDDLRYQHKDWAVDTIKKYPPTINKRWMFYFEMNRV